jgi:pimeloyl-ACP methyl ester carboxylesterase
MQPTATTMLAGDDDGTDRIRAPLVLLHGLTYDRHLWGPCLSALRTLDPARRVVNLDLPGHGASPRWPAYRLDSVADAVHDTITAAGIDTPVIVGHSAAAAIATIYASRHPTRGVINVDQPLAVRPFGDLLRAHRATLEGPGYAAVWDMLHRDMHTELLPAEARRLEESISDPRQDLLLGYWAEIMDTEADDLDATIRGSLATVRTSGIPYHLVLGTEPDPRYRTWHTDALPDSQITVIAGSGHFPQLAHPATFAHLLTATETW